MLPENFTKRMKEYLGDEFDSFLNSFEQKVTKGVRINSLKATKELVKPCFKEFEPVPFSSLTYKVDTEKLGNMPMHSAGAFYSQEPSAASAVTILDPKPFDKVLDLCAAPGGKSTQIATLLEGKGLLWSNEIVKNRANILLSNIERMGIKNAVVSSAYPEDLCSKLEGFFDKVLVDAPCSGEGMFRKNAGAIEYWSIEHVKACAQRQVQILASATKALKENGVLVYSTCTFSKEENEDVCLAFLEENPDFELVPIVADFGRKAMGIDALRIYPMDGGEGHFVAKFVKKSTSDVKCREYLYPKKENILALDFYKENFKQNIFGKTIEINDKIIILPENLPDLKGLRVLRAGVELGTIKAKRILPSHSLFMAENIKNCQSFLNFDNYDEMLYRFLKGEEIPCDKKSYTAVAVKGVTIGFGKASGGTLKNHYPKGLRYI